MTEIINSIWNNKIDIYFIQIILAIIYFFLISWIGSKSFSLGYTSLTLYVQEEEALGFNFVFRILSPLIYLILICSLLEIVGLGRYNEFTFLISIFYILLRFLFIILSGRFVLVNWAKEIFFWFMIITSSYILYDKLIKNRISILPDFNNLTNEIWLVVLFFLYELFNRMKFSQDYKLKKINTYIYNKYMLFKNKYEYIIDKKVYNKKLKPLIYAIIIYESFNRYKIARLIEQILFRIGKAKTLGIMQVKTNELINDEQSIERGINKILIDFKEILKQNNLKQDEYINQDELYYIYYDVLIKYNYDADYARNILEIKEKIEEKYYPEFLKENVISETYVDIKKDEKKDVKKD